LSYLHVINNNIIKCAARKRILLLQQQGFSAEFQLVNSTKVCI